MPALDEFFSLERDVQNFSIVLSNNEFNFVFMTFSFFKLRFMQVTIIIYLIVYAFRMFIVSLVNLFVC